MGGAPLCTRPTALSSRRMNAVARRFEGDRRHCSRCGRWRRGGRRGSPSWARGVRSRAGGAGCRGIRGTRHPAPRPGRAAGPFRSGR